MTRRARPAPASLAAVVLAALTLGGSLSVPRALAHEPDVTVAVEEPDGRPAPARVDERRELVIHGQADHDGVPPLERVELSLSAPGLADACELPSYEPVPPGEAADFRRPLPAPGCNGTWTVAATAVTADEPTFGHGRTRRLATATFELAVPPEDPRGLRVTTEGDDGAEDRSVTLTWAANPEADLAGYRIDRAAPDEGFELLTVIGPDAEPALTDDELRKGGDHRYRVYAVRTGVTPDDADLVTSLGFDEASIEVAQPPATTTTTATSGGEATTTSRPRSVTSSRPRSAPAPAATARPRTPTTADTGFGETLPFDPSQTTLPAPPAEAPPTSGAPPADGAVVALTEEGADDGGTRRLLVPVAGSLALLVGAAHVRHVVRRASEPEDVIHPL